MKAKAFPERQNESKMGIAKANTKQNGSQRSKTLAKWSERKKIRAQRTVLTASYRIK
jgi:hypothetical protein